MFKQESEFENNQDYSFEGPMLSFENYDFFEPQMNNSYFNTELFESRQSVCTGESSPNSLTKSQSWGSSNGDNNSVVEEEAEQDVLKSCDLLNIKNMVHNTQTNLCDFLDKHVFCDQEFAVEIKPLGTIECATKNKKIRKSPAQTKILKQAYYKNDDWDREFMEKLSARTGLTSEQVYKWYASQRYKNHKLLPKNKKGAKKNFCF